MGSFKDFPRIGWIRFASACEEFLKFQKTDGTLSPEEQDALQPYVEKLRSLIERHQQRRPESDTPGIGGTEHG